MIHCEKITVRLGKTPAAVPANWGNAWTALPGGSIAAGHAVIPPGTAALAPNSQSETGVNLKFPKKLNSEGPIQAITIAPDSAIEACDLYISGGTGNRVHRVAPGAPFIGVIREDDQIKVAPIRPLPLIALDEQSDFELYGVAWDCSVGTDDDLLTDQSTDLATFLPPLRLNVYRGHVPPPVLPTKRAPYEAKMLWRFAGGATEQQAQLYVFVDGRRRFRVEAARTSGAEDVALAVYGLDGFSSLVATGLGTDRRVAFPTLSPLLVSTNLEAVDGDSPRLPKVLDYVPTSGNPWVAILATVTTEDSGAGDPIDGYVMVRAWDD